MEQSIHSKAVTQYYKGLKEQTTGKVDLPVVYSYALDMVEQLVSADQLLPIYGAESIDAALTLPDDEREVMQHLAFMPIEHLGPLLGETYASTSDIKTWHGKALLYIPRVEQSYLENSAYRYDSEAKPRTIQTELQSTYQRLRKFAESVLTLPDFTEDKYIYDLQRRRSIDLSLVRSLTWGGLISARKCKQHIEDYDISLGLRIDHASTASHSQRDDPKG